MKNTTMSLILVVSLGFGAWGFVLNNNNLGKESNLMQNNLAQVAATQTAFTPNIPTNQGLSLITDTTFGESKVSEWPNYGTDGLSYSSWRVSQPAPYGGRNITVTDSPWGNSAFETVYPGNNLGNGEGGAEIVGPEGQKWTKVYFSMSVWLPTNYSVHSNGEKWLYMYTTADGDPSFHATLLQWLLGGSETPNGSTWGLELLPDSARTYGTDLTLYPNTGAGGPYFWIFQNPNTPRLQKGKWQTVEAYFVMNTPGQRDGQYKVWIDGVQVMNGSDAIFRGGTTQGYFQGIKFDGTRGGGASSTPTPAGGQVRRYGRLAWYAYPSSGVIPPVTPITNPSPLPTPAPTPTGSISVSPTKIQFTATVGGPKPAPQNIVVTVPSGAKFTTNDNSSFYDSSTCYVGGTTQCSSGTAVVLTPSVIPTTPGTYQSDITISSSGLASVTVPVTLVVSAATPVTNPDPIPTPTPTPTPVPITTPTPLPTISVGSTVYTTTRLNVRSSASATSRKIGVQSLNAKGVVTAGPITSGGFTWWKVNFTKGADGWVINSLKQ